MSAFHSFGAGVKSDGQDCDPSCWVGEWENWESDEKRKKKHLLLGNLKRGGFLRKFKYIADTTM
jgi:hypothetical protein